MNKQARERLRQDCSNFIGGQAYFYPSEAKDMIALLDHIDALEGVIGAADNLVSYMEDLETHGEGSDGILDGCALCILIKKFRDSQAALAQAEE